METQPPVTNSNNNKIGIIIGVVLLICVCLGVVAIAALAVLGPAVQTVAKVTSYTGNADEQLKTDVLNAITDFEAKENNCSDVSLFSGQVILGPDQTSDHSWTETWQLTACGESHLYSVQFTPSPQGGTDYSVKRLDQ